MNVTLRHAVVSWCSDLTSPNATSVPLAVLLVARSEAGCYATSVSLRASAELDPMTAATLQDISVVIRAHVDAIMREHPEIDAVLGRLSSSLRGSLHVASISDERSMTIGSHMDLIKEAKQQLFAARRSQKAEASPAAHSERPRGWLPVPEMAQLPAMQQWQIDECNAQSRARS